MGFKAKRKTLTLKFTDPDYDGFEVVMRRMTIDDTFTFNDYELREWEAKVRAGDIPKAEIDARMQEMWEGLADAVVSWNLEDDRDNPIPVSVAAIRGQDPDFFWTLVRAWIMAMLIKVDDDTKAPSSDGKPSEELQIPMEPLSGSRAS
ncbi:hypothetical protein [Amycolatopsis sp. WQ 127309]|uniref:hypothetical protein n=1 Tax=Amycolatopsis sp. WQ 127309 TaxID=2932773 RepID=UPI001FF27035|nr:hypothetical protein [Amycolatopsis sp. WQ 127309]UOZ10548.1 hypothetical protein MUY22_20695 [Amycolatopsis sp. WQ 127309]